MIFVDTNVVSETMRLQPDRAVMQWIERHLPHVCLSTVVIAECVFGIRKVPEPQRSPRWNRQLDLWRTHMLRRTYAFDESVADIYGDIMGASARDGRNISVLDGMIAATAIRHGGALATRNVRHFDGIGLQLINPWMDA